MCYLRVVFVVLCALVRETQAGRWASMFVQKSEAEHWGGKWTQPSVVNELFKFAEEADLLLDTKTNDLDVHHSLVAKFCKSRDEGCTWQEYHAAFDGVREPFSGHYDPKPDQLFYLSDLRKLGAQLQDCARYDKLPTAKEMLTLMRMSKPVVFAGAAKHWPAVKRWTFEYLLKHLGNRNVVASVSPNGYFDAPESSALWGLPGFSDKFNVTEDIVIARPGHINLEFEKFVKLLKNAGKEGQLSLYLEYFPLFALAKDVTSVEDIGKESCRADIEDSVLEDLENMDFANFLFPRQRLFWMGAGKTVGALHFDRAENLMVVLRGSKRFTLVPPDQSEGVYGGKKLRSTNYFAHYNRSDGSVMIARNLSSVSPTAVAGVYSPVNISAVNPKHFPKASSVTSLACDVNEGDIAYIPSQWWHEVESFPDEEGKTIGVNFFYEPLWRHHMYVVDSGVGVQNRYYNYVLDGKDPVATPCSDNHVCFVDPAV